MTFSTRHGYNSQGIPITVREDAPADLRFAVVGIARNKCGVSSDRLGQLICGVLFVAPDEGNWSEGNVWGEVQLLMRQCDWFKVYDVAEEIWRSLELQGPEHEYQGIYASELNRFFCERGIGWELRDDVGIVFRGDETFTQITEPAEAALRDAGRDVAAQEIHEALRDLSRRPADLTGAVQHAAAALECTARDLTGDPKATLGPLIKKLGLPKPLDEAVEKLWGFASNNARHLNEGGKLAGEDVQLVVQVACTICIYLTAKPSA